MPLDAQDILAVEGVVLKLVTPRLDGIFAALHAQEEKSNTAVTAAATAVATAASTAATAVHVAAAAAAAAVLQHDTGCQAKAEVERIRLDLARAGGVLSGVRWTAGKIALAASLAAGSVTAAAVIFNFVQKLIR
jgi:hypothetical protein